MDSYTNISWAGLFLVTFKSGTVHYAFKFFYLSIRMSCVNLKLAAKCLLGPPFGSISWLFTHQSLLPSHSGSWISVCDTQSWVWLKNSKLYESGDHHARIHYTTTEEALSQTSKVGCREERPPCSFCWLPDCVFSFESNSGREETMISYFWFSFSFSHYLLDIKKE